MISRANMAMIGVLCAGLAAGCGRGDRDEAELDVAGNDIDITQARPTVETGCLTASGDRYVLTSLETSDTAGGTTTELYQLIGEGDELRQHVGKTVRVTGEVQPARVAEVRESSPGTTTGTGGTGGGFDAKVSTQTTTRIETQHLRVQSVTATGDDCAEAGGLTPTR